jgi:hypothetical protein
MERREGVGNQKCPVCSYALDYFNYGHYWDVDGTPYIYHVVICPRAKCLWRGREWYQVVVGERLIFKGLTPRAIKPGEEDLVIPGRKGK